MSDQCGYEPRQPQVFHLKTTSSYFYSSLRSFLIHSSVKKTMGFIKMHQSFKTRVTPNRMFKALIMDSHNLCPKLMFSSIKSIEYLQGNGEVGSIKQMNFTEG